MQETVIFRNGIKMTTQSLLPNALIDALLSNYKKPEDLIGENGLLKQLTKALVERALQAEMTEHLGHDKYCSHVEPGTGGILACMKPFQKVLSQPCNKAIQDIGLER